MKLQDYSKKDTIEGVRLIDLPHHYDDGGSFMEIARLSAENVADISPMVRSNIPLDGLSHIDTHYFEDIQINYSVIHPGVVKGFHLHKHQWDYWFIPPFQRVIVGLLDLRGRIAPDGSECIGGATYMRIFMGIKPQLLVIPAGVAHAIKCIDDRPNCMIYLTNQHFSPDDEHRIMWDILGKDFWEIQNG